MDVLKRKISTNNNNKVGAAKVAPFFVILFLLLPHQHFKKTQSMKGFYTILLLIASNIFMTLAWYGHLKTDGAKKTTWWVLVVAILVSWGIAFFEYVLQVPANKIGFKGNGGPFSLIQLKVIQEVLSLLVFMGFTLFAFKEETFKWNHIVAFGLIVVAVYLVFKK